MPRCIDCQEEIYSYELADKQSCRRCLGPMHGECAMADWHERPVCEACLRVLEIEYKKWVCARVHSRRRPAQQRSTVQEIQEVYNVETGGEVDGSGDEMEPGDGEGGADGGDRLVH